MDEIENEVDDEQVKSPIERMREHYFMAHKDGDKNNLLSFDVKEIGLKVFVKPPTLADESKYSKMVQDGNPEGFVEMILARAKNHMGMPLFHKRDKKMLMHQDSGLISEIAIGISKVDEEYYGNREEAYSHLKKT